MTLRVRIHHELVGAGPGSRFVLDVDVTLGHGVTAFVGPSGSGKSSTILTIAGLLPGVRASVRLNEEIWDDLARGPVLPPEKRGVAFVPQSLALFPHLTARENVSFPIPGPHADRLILADGLLSRMRLGHVAHRHPAALSGGEAQRVALARAMARKPRLVLLDEPFSALDSGTRVTMYEVLADWLLEAAVPAIIVTHDEREAERFATRTILFDRGKATME